MKAKILWIEGKRADSPSFLPTLRKKEFLDIEAVSTGSAALERAPDLNPVLVVVNAASMRSSGKRICRSLRDKLNGLPIILIIAPGTTSDDLCANVTLTLPFTVRKLLNRITPFLPGEGENLLRVGNICLDLEKKQVVCEQREARLTPRLAHILQILMLHTGSVVEREVLFREVWKTEYTGDTRTLDVHISWLRQAIEEDPRSPRYLKTIRKVGYRLDA